MQDVLSADPRVLEAAIKAKKDWSEEDGEQEYEAVDYNDAILDRFEAGELRQDDNGDFVDEYGEVFELMPLAQEVSDPDLAELDRQLADCNHIIREHFTRHAIQQGMDPPVPNQAKQQANLYDKLVQLNGKLGLSRYKAIEIVDEIQDHPNGEVTIENFRIQRKVPRKDGLQLHMMKLAQKDGKWIFIKDYVIGPASSSSTPSASSSKRNLPVEPDSGSESEEPIKRATRPKKPVGIAPPLPAQAPKKGKGKAPAKKGKKN